MIKIYNLVNIETNELENVYENNVISSLYYFTHKLPKLPENKLEELKRDISRISNVAPLYDVYTDNLYLIKQDNLYNAVFRHYYRFPTIKFLGNLKIQKKEYEKEVDELQRKLISDCTESQIFLLKRSIRKYKLIFKFMDNFDNQILLDTYIKALYNTQELGKSITLCKKPSFVPNFKYIKPYFTQDEIINTALNSKLITLSDVDNIPNSKIRSLCSEIKNNDINYTNLINHHNYIIKNKLIGLIQYYSMQGSFIFNEYLRNDKICDCEYYNELIKLMSNLIVNAPKFNKEYILYRFIEDDSFIKNLKVGDIYIERGFLSTTRNPFYKQTIKNDTFGWILLKIKLPINCPALCIETLSMFPLEQEIIFAPNTQLKLISKNKKYLYYHTDKKIQNKIKKKYEFEIIDKSANSIKKNKCEDLEIPEISFLKLSNKYNYSNKEKIIEFINKHTNQFNHFYTKIGNEKFLLIAEEYDSLNSYKKFYAITTENGFCIYCIYKNHQIFNIEIGENDIYVNYNIKYSPKELKDIIKRNDFLKFVASVAYYFNIDNVILYCDYYSCDYAFTQTKIKIPKISGVFCYDMYDYVKNNVKKYKNKNIKPRFNYKLLDLLKTTDANNIISKFTKNNTTNVIYHIYHDIYKVKNKEDDVASFYIWLVENDCYYVDDLLNELNKIPEYINDNPFIFDYYEFNPINYLIDKKLIDDSYYINNLYEFDNKNKFKNKMFNRFINSDKNQINYVRKNNLLISDNI